MASTIITKNKAEGAPSSLAAGELAINTNDGSLYYGSTDADTGTSVSSSFTFGAITGSVISSSGNIYADTYYTEGKLLGGWTGTKIELGQNNKPIKVRGTVLEISGSTSITLMGQVTASLNISASGNVEGGSLRADDLTAGRVAFIGTDGLLVDDSDLTFTTATLTATNLASTTVDTTNLEVTTIKAKDGTAAIGIADSSGVVTLASSVLTTTDINGGTINGCDITVGTGKRLDVSSGTLTLAANQISGDKVEGGTIAATTISTLTTTSVILDGNTITGINDASNFTDDDAHIMTSAAINDKFAVINADTTGNAATATLAADATTLATPRAINGVNFDGSAAITIPTSRVYNTSIKLLPIDFMPNDDGGTSKGITLNDSGTTGMKPGADAMELVAIVDIPEGFTATHVDIHDNSHDFAVNVFEMNINASGMAARGSGNANTTFAISSGGGSGGAVDATATNFLAIRVETTSPTERVFGGTITIAPQ